MKKHGGGRFNSFKNIYNKTSYALKPFLIFACFIMITFYGALVATWFKGGEGLSTFPHLPIDDQIPLITQFVYVYYLTFPLGIVTFFYLAYANKNSFYNLFYTLLISYAISGIIYLVFPVVFVKPDFVPVSFTDKLAVKTWAATNPATNCFPSQHAYMAFAMILACLFAGKDMKWWYKVFTIIVGILIVLSTFFLKQHYFIDWVVSACIMFPVFLAVVLFRRKLAKRQAGKQTQTCGKQNKS